jgi:hypothetical protein
MTKKIVLTMTLADGIEADGIIELLNADILCRLEDDDKFITGWEWIY